MPTYRVIRKSDGEEVTRYCAGQVTEQINADSYPLADFDHTEFVEGAVIAQVNPDNWKIWVGSFFDRFGQYKLAILASDDLYVQAMIKDATVRKYIDLLGRRDELLLMIGMLQSKGFAVDAVAILDVEPVEAEIYRG